jgi:polyisoprenoid-binding protein YceI
MKTKLAVLLSLLAFGLSSAAGAGNYAFDKAHSHVGFTVKHILSKVPGDFKEYDGTFTFDPKKPEASKINVTIQAASINTNNDMRDKHLKSPDFFDAEKFPTLDFKSAKVTAAGDSKYTVVGDLTLHGVTKPVTLSVEYLGSDQMMGSEVVAFTAVTRIDRRDFGLTWTKVLASGNLMVGNDVDIALEITGMDKDAMEKMKKKTPKKPSDSK